MLIDWRLGSGSVLPTDMKTTIALRCGTKQPSLDCEEEVILARFDSNPGAVCLQCEHSRPSNWNKWPCCLATAVKRSLVNTDNTVWYLNVLLSLRSTVWQDVRNRSISFIRSWFSKLPGLCVSGNMFICSKVKEAFHFLSGRSQPTTHLSWPFTVISQCKAQPACITRGKVMWGCVCFGPVYNNALRKQNYSREIDKLMWN